MEESILEDKAISVRKFVSARTQELLSLSSRVSKGNGQGGGSIPYQHIPKHLRRRAVSHNVKRIPNRFRPPLKKDGSLSKDALSFVSTKKKKKQFSRKHRRRNSNLLLLYNRRQRIHKWMETHIWHAKRFYMDLKWNCKVPISSCEKGQRAIYRSAKRYATMQDISFMTCLELTGDFEELCVGFSSIAPRQCNTLSVGAVMYKNGEREGTLNIYHQNSYPFGFIGQIQFTWLKTKVSSSTTVKESESSSLWIWVHPAFKDEFISVLTCLFSLHPTPLSSPETKDEIDDESKESKSLSIDEIKLLGKKLHCNPSWKNPEKNTSLKDLNGELNRLRLYGPDVFSVLQEALHVHSPEKQATVDCQEKSKGQNFWLPPHQNDDDTAKFLVAQNLLWSILESSTNIPSYSVLPLTVRDPRVFLPQSRTKVLCDFYGDDEEGEENLSLQAEEEVEDSEMQVDNSGGSSDKKENTSMNMEIYQMFNKFISIAQSPLENPDIRLNIIKEKMTDEEYCNRRAQLLIPGSQIDFGEDENQVPIILIQRPSSSNSKSFNDSGFDLILPAGWVMAFWISFVYRAVRVAGLRDSKTFAFESSNLHSLQYIAPDSKAGNLEEKELEEKVRSEFFKQPPAKRANVIKLGCISPFKCDWNSLVIFWQNFDNQPSMPAISSQFYILRDSNLLKTLAQNVRCKKWLELSTNLLSVEHGDRCLIGVRIESLNRGKAIQGAVICLPMLCDFENLCAKNTKSKSLGTRNVSDPPIHTEPARDDKEMNKKRAEFRQKHQKFMAYLRKKRKNLREKVKQNLCEEASKLSKVEPNKKKKSLIDDDPESKILHYDSSKVSQVYNEKINEMWLIPQDKLIDSFRENSRLPSGFVIHGGDEYSKGKCSALGFVTLKSLLEFTKLANSSNEKLTNVILWRNWQDSFTYRAAKFEICHL